MRNYLLGLALLFPFTALAQTGVPVPANIISTQTHECRAYAHRSPLPQRVNGQRSWQPFRLQVSDRQRAACLADPKTLVGSQQTHNIWLNAGHDVQSQCLFGTSTCNPIKYIGLCTDTATPAATDSGCTTEVTTTRPTCTWTHTSGNAQSACAWCWTNSTGSSQTLGTIIAATATNGATVTNKALLYAAPNVTSTGVQTGTYTFNLIQ